jgi:uncharacterized protein YukJ
VALDRYGVLVGRATRTRREGGADSPHYQVKLSAGEDYRIAVNVLSQEQPSELLYHVDDDLQHPLTAAIAGLSAGWHDLPSKPGGASLDYVRANLFTRAQMRTLPPDVSGPDNDLADLLDHYVERAIATTGARVFAFGQRWGPETTRDKVFGFRPGNGVHDIHMNQGNVERFRRDDGVWQDGGLLVHFPADGRWVGVFLAFQSQSFHTDDVTGHEIEGPPAPPAPPEPGIVTEHPPVAIVAAMVNPSGPAPERESVLLINASPSPIDLSGWRIVDRLKRACAVPGGSLAPGATRSVPMTDGVTLGNKGGAITLLDAKGLKMHGVAYTEEQAGREGWTVVF